MSESDGGAAGPAETDSTAPRSAVSTVTPLRTRRLTMRPWRVTDARFRRELWAERDPRTPPHRRIDADGRPSVDDMAEAIRRSEPPDSLGLWVVERADTGTAIGYCGLIANTSGRPDEPEIAYEFRRAEWGQGFATESARVVVEWAAERGHDRLWAPVRAWNHASRRVLDKLEFVQTDRIEPGEVHGDMVFYTKRLGTVDLSRPA